uniref:Tim44 domain-containing protein n=1 Tax=Acidicaldus sp. TaxID=1872105 RepID=A0A8J4H8Q7_9PROT
MRRIRLLLAALLVALWALSPIAVEARAGSSSSMGSRGSRTYMAPPATGTSPYSAAPLERSMTPRSNPGYRAGNGYGMAPSHPFLSGLFGGFLGAGLMGMLLGHGFFWGMGGFGGFFGFFLQIILIIWLVRFLARRFVGPRLMPAGMAPRVAPAAMGGGMGGSSRGPAIGPADFHAFEQALQAIQAAWSAHDLDALGRLATPEMRGYFAEQLADQASRGVRNEVRDVRLERGDLAEAWSEQGRDYATVAMQFSMLDMTRDATGRIVDGSATERVTATELWTFMRAPGGAWILSAIQQAR